VRIETVTKVGYRLVGPVILIAPAARQPLASEKAFANDAAPDPITELPVARRRWWLMLVLAAAVLGAFAVIGVRVARPPSKPLQATLRLGIFKTVSADIPSTLPDALESELLRRFGEVTTVLISAVRQLPADLAQAYVVSGTIGRTKDSLHFVVNLEREVTGETPISLTFDLPAGQSDPAVKSVAAMSAKVVGCALHGAVEARTVPLPEQAVRLWSQYCKSTNAIKPYPAFEQATLRGAVKISPDFAVAWVAMGSSIAATTSEADITARRGGFAEAMAALAKAEKLGLSNFMSLDVRAKSVAGRDWAARGALLRESAERFSIDSNGTATGNYANFLLNVGRIAKANDQLRLRLQINPLSQRAAARRAMAMTWSGQTAESEALTREVLATWSGEPIAVQSQIGDALGRGNYAAALAAVTAAPDVKPPM